jgi:rhodanese-related sulfurtransferase
MTDVQSTTSTLDCQMLSARLARGEELRLLDVRSPAEFEAVHIPGSINVPLDILSEHLDELACLAQPLVLICRSGNRATQAARTLAEAGITDVPVLEGGILAWEPAGGAVHRGRQHWDLERQVRFVAGSLVLVGILGSVVFRPAKWLAATVGAGLVVAALRNSCLMGLLLSKLPYNRGASCNPSAALAQLRQPLSPEQGT